MGRTLSYNAVRSGVAVSVDFDKLLKKIEKAGGDIESATWDAARKGGRVYYQHLVEECKKSNVPDDLINRIRFNCERDSSGNRYAVVVGWVMDNYNPDNPSAGYKVVFLNYGTPRRETRFGNRGFITGRGFIGRAKRRSRTPIKKAQETFLNDLLRGLK